MLMTLLQVDGFFHYFNSIYMSLNRDLDLLFALINHFLNESSLVAYVIYFL